MSSIKRFVIHYSHFLTGNIFVLLTGLVSFPIITRVLEKEEYGVLGLITTTMFLAVAVAKVGLSEGIVRFYKEYSETKERRDIFSSTIVVRGFMFCMITCLLYVILLPSLSKYLRIDSKYMNCFFIMVICLFLRPMNTIVLQILRANGKTVFLNIIAMVGSVMTFLLSLFFFFYVFKELYGYLIGVVVGECFTSVVLYYWFFSNYKLVIGNVSKDVAIKVIKFGVPLLLTELSYLLLIYTDRYMITYYYGENVLAVYSVAFAIPSYVSNIIVGSLTWAIIPIYVEIFQKEGKEKTEDFLQKSLYYLFILIIPIIFGYFSVCNELIITFASEKYAIASKISPIILIGLLVLGINNVLNAGLYLKKKTVLIFAIMLTGLGANVVMNLILLPVYGAMGAAIANLVSCSMVVILSSFVSFKYINVHINLKSILYYIGVSIVMMLVLSNVKSSFVSLNLIVKILLGIVIIALGIMYKEKGILLRVRYVYEAWGGGIQLRKEHE